jgi:hypothetical protein
VGRRLLIVDRVAYLGATRDHSGAEAVARIHYRFVAMMAVGSKRGSDAAGNRLGVHLEVSVLLVRDVLKRNLSWARAK